MTAIGTLSWPPFQLQKETLKEVLWDGPQLGGGQLCRTQISALLTMRSKETPITQLLIFEVSGGGAPHPTAAGNTKIHHKEGRGFHGDDGEQSKRPWGAVLAHFSQTWLLFIMKPGAGRAAKGIWAEMTKKWVHS